MKRKPVGPFRLVAAALLLCAIGFATGCATTYEIRRPTGDVEYLIGCDAGWNICYDKATELCPGGYKKLAEETGFNNKKELQISCPAASQRRK